MPQEDSAVAISSDGRWVYAIDAAHGTIALVNVRRLRVASVSHADLSMLDGGQVHARVSADRARLYMTWGDELQRFDAATLEAAEPLRLEDAGAVEFVDSAIS